MTERIRSYTDEELLVKAGTNAKEEIQKAGLIRKKLDVQLDDNTLIDKYNDEEVISLVKNDRNLLFWSKNPGTGKTVSANKIALNYIQSRISNSLKTAKETDRYVAVVNAVQFININELLFLRKDFNNPESQEKSRYLERRIKECDLVIWDDVGLSDYSSYDKEYLTMLIDGRLNQYHKANIYTSNCIGELLYNNVGARLYSRIMENTEVIEFKGGDRR